MVAKAHTAMDPFPRGSRKTRPLVALSSDVALGMFEPNLISGKLQMGFGLVSLGEQAIAIGCSRRDLPTLAVTID